MTPDNRSLPSRPFFSCTPEQFVIVDGSEAKSSLLDGSLTPWMSFSCGNGNVIDTVPRKVSSWHEGQVVVECDGGTVHIDFGEGSARKTTTQGEFLYMGTLEDRNEGRGYIPIS